MTIATTNRGGTGQHQCVVLIKRGIENEHLFFFIREPNVFVSPSGQLQAHFFSSSTCPSTILDNIKSVQALVQALQSAKTYLTPFCYAVGHIPKAQGVPSKQKMPKVIKARGR